MDITSSRHLIQHRDPAGPTWFLLAYLPGGRGGRWQQNLGNHMVIKVWLDRSVLYLYSCTSIKEQPSSNNFSELDFRSFGKNEKMGFLWNAGNHHLRSFNPNCGCCASMFQVENHHVPLGGLKLPPFGPTICQGVPPKRTYGAGEVRNLTCL